MSVKTEDVNSNIVKKELVEEEGVLDDHALKVEKFVKTEMNLKPYLQVNILHTVTSEVRYKAELS